MTHTRPSLPLRARFPNVYDALLTKLETVGLQPYDAMSDVYGPTNEGTYVLRIQYGPSFEFVDEYVGTEARFLALEPELGLFLDNSISACRQAVVNGYKSMMRETRP